ncbi:hypothetical protein B0H19DRAFT_1276439 [Mycena capillaripes]|nr:hypothetical protein B0H19DRAFT_1276439 [Mycena capillaripes]
MAYSDTYSVAVFFSASLRPAGSPLATDRHKYVHYLAAELGDEYTFCEQEADMPTPAALEAGPRKVQAQEKEDKVYNYEEIQSARVVQDGTSKYWEYEVKWKFYGTEENT